MPVELRKRKAPAEPAQPPPAKKKTNPIKNAVNKAKAAVTSKKDTSSNGTGGAGDSVVGSSITIEGFGGEVETNDGEKTTLKKLLDASKAGVVLFTYPKASTPGCTTQACMFRDDYTVLTATGLSIYGLSRDSPKANTTFKTKQKLPYPLLCDPSANLIGAIGFKKPGGTIRGVYAVDKTGKVLVAQPGGPAATVEAIRTLVNSQSAGEKVDTEMSNAPADAAKTKTTAPKAESAAKPAIASEAAAVDDSKDEVKAGAPTVNGTTETKEDQAAAKVAAEVADTAAKLDKDTPKPA